MGDSKEISKSLVDEGDVYQKVDMAFKVCIHHHHTRERQGDIGLSSCYDGSLVLINWGKPKPDLVNNYLWLNIVPSLSEECCCDQSGRSGISLWSTKSLKTKQIWSLLLHRLALHLRRYIRLLIYSLSGYQNIHSNSNSNFNTNLELNTEWIS